MKIISDLEISSRLRKLNDGQHFVVRGSYQRKRVLDVARILEVDVTTRRKKDSKYEFTVELRK